MVVRSFILDKIHFAILKEFSIDYLGMTRRMNKFIMIKTSYEILRRLYFILKMYLGIAIFIRTLLKRLFAVW